MSIIIIISKTKILKLSTKLKILHGSYQPSTEAGVALHVDSEPAAVSAEAADVKRAAALGSAHSFPQRLDGTNEQPPKTADILEALDEFRGQSAIPGGQRCECPESADTQPETEPSAADQRTRVQAARDRAPAPTIQNQVQIVEWQQCSIDESAATIILQSSTATT